MIGKYLESTDPSDNSTIWQLSHCLAASSLSTVFKTMEIEKAEVIHLSTRKTIYYESSRRKILYGSGGQVLPNSR